MSYGRRPSGSGYGNNRSYSRKFGTPKKGKFYSVTNNALTSGSNRYKDPFEEGRGARLTGGEREDFVITRKGEQFVLVKSFIPAKRRKLSTVEEAMDTANLLAEEWQKKGFDVIVERNPFYYYELDDKEQVDKDGFPIQAYYVYRSLTPSESEKYKTT